MPERQSYVIVGGGIAGATAADLLRSEEPDAELTVITDDTFPVYYRPALKDYLGGKLREDKLWAKPIRFYEERRVRFVNDAVVNLHPQQYTVQLQSGQSISYNRLLLAHGARAADLQCPGRQLRGVTTLRTVADYQDVLRQLKSVRRVVVVGSGTLALETVEVLRHRDFAVTHLVRSRTLWSEVLDRTASDMVLQQEQRDGVDVRLEQEIAECIGQNGYVSGVVTKTGIHIACEMVIIAIGIEPILTFVKSAGIACKRGIQVNAFMQTSIPDIYAAGDVIETTDALAGRARVLGQWYPAIQQARAAAYSMLERLDTQQTFSFGNFYNATFLYGLDFASVGTVSLPRDTRGYQELVADPQPRSYQKVVVRDGVPVGVLTLGERQKTLAFKRAIDHQVNVEPVLSRLFAPDFHLNKWLDAQGVPAPILGVSRQGAMAVQQATASSKKPVDDPQLLAEAVLVSSQGQEVYLSKIQVVQIGRQEGCELVLKDSSISRRHAEISYANERYVLRDLGSTNGTYVNDVRLAKDKLALLKNGDVLRFGTVTTVTYTVKIREIDAGSSMLGKQHHSIVEGEQGPDYTISLPSQQTVSQRPKFNTEGTLSLPEATDVIVASVVTQFKTTPTLIAVLPQGQTAIFPLSAGKHFILGRATESDLRINDMSISRKHAELFPGYDEFYIRDLGSSNGVSVNQTKIDNPYRLSSNDRILLGNVPIYFFDHRVGGRAANSEELVVRATPQENSCRHCGYTNSKNARFCAKCGAAQ